MNFHRFQEFGIDVWVSISALFSSIPSSSIPTEKCSNRTISALFSSIPHSSILKKSAVIDGKKCTNRVPKSALIGEGRFGH